MPFGDVSIWLFRWSRIWVAVAFALALCAPYALAQPVDSNELRRTLEASISKVPEFAAIQAEAEKRGLRVWLLGGAAASVAEHGKQNILGQAQAERLIWDLDNILLPEQDLDLVITRRDGHPESVEEIDNFLEWIKNQSPRTADGKSRWDAIGLRTAVPHRNKMPLEGNPDFLDQHNDSLSLGMLEVTKPEPGESLVRNLGNKSDFLRDAAGDSFQFLPSPNHASTARFKDGRNPPILSAMRAIEKAVRYNKELDPASVKEISKTIAEWDPQSVQAGSYVHNYLTGRGKRLVTHAQNLEDGFALLDQTGFRQKLLALPGVNPNEVDSLGWWLNKLPLPRYATGGTPTGKTAGDLGIKEAYHWTSDSVHRLMSWNYDGTLRAFQSRQNAPGEAAVLKDGYYTFANDSTPTRSTNGSATRFVKLLVDPSAREGVDFIYDANTRTAVWKSSAFLKVVSEAPNYPKDLRCSQLFGNAVLMPPNPPRPLLQKMGGIPGLMLLVGGGGYYGLYQWQEIRREKTERLYKIENERIRIHNEMIIAARKEAAAKKAMDDANNEVLRQKGQENTERLNFLKALSSSDREGAKSLRCLQIISTGEPKPEEPDCQPAQNVFPGRSANLLMERILGPKALPTKELVAAVRDITSHAGVNCVDLVTQIEHLRADLVTAIKACRGQPLLTQEGVPQKALQRLYAQTFISRDGKAVEKAMRVKPEDHETCSEWLSGVNPYHGSRLENCLGLNAFRRKIAHDLANQIPVERYPADISSLQKIEVGHYDCFVGAVVAGVEWEKAAQACGSDGQAPVRSCIETLVKKTPKPSPAEITQNCGLQP